MLKSHQKINLDHVGFWASTLCAIHCAIIPVLLTFSTLGFLSFLEHPFIEGSMLGIAVIVAFASILPSYFQKHQKLQPILLTVLGFAFIFWGRVTSIEIIEAIATVLGGLLVAFSHLVNAHLLKKWEARLKRASVDR